MIGLFKNIKTTKIKQNKKKTKSKTKTTTKQNKAKQNKKTNKIIQLNKLQKRLQNLGFLMHDKSIFIAKNVVSILMGAYIRNNNINI